MVVVSPLAFTLRSVTMPPKSIASIFATISATLVVLSPSSASVSGIAPCIAVISALTFSTVLSISPYTFTSQAAPSTLVTFMYAVPFAPAL